MLVAAGLLVSTLALTYWLNRRALARSAGTKEAGRDEPVAPGNAFALVARDPYLLLLAALILVLNISTKTGDYVLDRMLISHAAERAASLGVSQSAFIGEFKARYFEWINVLEVVLQSLVVSRVIKYLGLRVALVMVPLVSLTGYSMTLAAPLIGILFATRVAENTLDYSLSSTVRQALWLATSREAKYKAKQVVDSFVWRAGDSLSAVVVWTGVHFAVGLRWFIGVNVGVSILWVLVAALTGTQYARRRSQETISPEAAIATAPA
jgi:AAA family ATP:ADP antiporter